MINKTARMLFGSAIDGFQRFPLTVIALLVTTLLANLEIANVLNFNSDLQIKLYSALAAFAMASLIKQIAIESYGYGAVLQHIGAGTAGLVAAAIAWFASDVGMTEVAFFAALAGGILTAAHWFRGTSEGFWFFVVQVIFAAGLSFVAVIIFGIGLTAILTSLDYLFGVGIPNKVFGHVWTTVLIGAGPIFALGRVPDDFDASPIIDGNNNGIAGLRLLSDFIAAPMLAIYALMLHVYALKIVITGDVPEGQIGWMVVGFGTLVIFFWKVMLPLREVLTRSGKLFLAYWPALIVIPLLLLFYAIYLRIVNYGITPERYFLAAFGGLMALFALMQAVPATRNWLPGAAPLTVMVLFLGSFGPWGAVHVSITSQVRHFTQLLDENNFVKKPNKTRARSILTFLRKNRGLERLKPLTAGFAKDPFKPEPNDSSYSLQTRLQQAFYADDKNKPDAQSGTVKFVRFSRGFISSKGFDLYLSNLSLIPDRVEYLKAPGDMTFKVDLESRAIKISMGEDVASFTFEPLRDFFNNSERNEDAQVFTLTSGTRKLLLIPSNMRLAINKEVELVSGSGTIFLRKSDWESVKPPG